MYFIQHQLRTTPTIKFKDKEVVLEDVARPAGEGVLVNVRSCGICGSDVTILDSGFPINGTPGHEIAGELEDGTPVAIEPIAPCGSCRFCDVGDTQACVRGTDMAYGVGRDGGMAEQIRVPERCIVPLPRSIDPDSGVLVEPLAVAVHGIRRARINGTMRVLAIGGGTIGLGAAVAARAAGAAGAPPGRRGGAGGPRGACVLGLGLQSVSMFTLLLH